MSAESQEQPKAADSLEGLDEAIQQKRQELMDAPADKMAGIVAEIQQLESEMLAATESAPKADNLLEHTTAQEPEIDAETVAAERAHEIEQMDAVRQRLGLSENVESAVEVPAELEADLMRLYADLDTDFGQPRQLGQESRTIMESISAADPSVQEALAEKFHQETIMNNFSGSTMTKFLGMYRSSPPGPFREKLRQIESARLEAAGFAPLK
ncbi:MAG: hypothetical protein JWN49_520 [Parcubacteria group bacterium]|nr:hypothetical protein [Parcubacteria group bacterium]